MEMNPRIEELAPTLLPPASETGASTTLDRPIRDSDEEIVAAVLAQELGGSRVRRFEDALRRVLSMPKSELDKQVKEEKRRRDQRG